MNLNDSVTAVKGVGEKTANTLAKLGVNTVEDLISYYPRSYTTYGEPVDISEIKDASRVAIKVTISTRMDIRRVRSLNVCSIYAKDFSGTIRLTWFNCQFLRNYFHIGDTYVFVGSPQMKNGMLTMSQPEYFTLEKYSEMLKVWQPVYALTAGITSKAIQKAVKGCDDVIDTMSDYLPDDVRCEHALAEVKTAIRDVHFPPNEERLRGALKRIAFDEFYGFLANMNALKESQEAPANVHKFEWNEEVTSFIRKLPYQLTNAQIEALRDMFADTSSEHVMNRLVQGDVGSGKTVVAEVALFACAKAGCQGVIMAPTEVLATQHFKEFQQMFTPWGIRVALLTGSTSAKEKRRIYSDIENHAVDIVVGTHALIQDKVNYQDLGLVVTDEQHRFGVRQREILSQKGNAPHILVMSATPIPRTLAIIMYGDLDISIIDKMPAGRIPIKNCVVDEGYRRTAQGFILSEVKKGHQVYIVCPMVEESDTMDDVANVISYTDELKACFPPEVNITYLHGKMKGPEKTQILSDFNQGSIHILVSTTVIEVGINNPNATVMMVENAERFGLAALHQLRGRVGRGNLQSYCIFISGRKDPDTMDRLNVLAESNDGFHIASEDLKRRGPGDFFGIRQSGDLLFKVGDIYKHADMLQAAAAVLRTHGDLRPEGSGGSAVFTKAVL